MNPVTIQLAWLDVWNINIPNSVGAFREVYSFNFFAICGKQAQGHTCGIIRK
ncbi:hypothetical protein MPQ_0675 [Methylovorus sp. MP688]|nr:hypothetical protein MPQ_0675 [Methylovorus sp. MP688]